MTHRPTSRGWKLWEKRRRLELRTIHGVTLCQAKQIALHERRCRAAIAETIGRPAAKALRLVACLGDDDYQPMFVLASEVDQQLWEKLAETPGLLRPIEWSPLATAFRQQAIRVALLSA